MTELKPRARRGGTRMPPMAIHQIQVRHEPSADRLLMQLRTTEADLYGVWLMRRMAARFYPPFRTAVSRASVAQTVPQSIPVPEARQMLEQTALRRPLPGTDFQKPFARLMDGALKAADWALPDPSPPEADATVAAPGGKPPDGPGRLLS